MSIDGESEGQAKDWGRHPSGKDNEQNDDSDDTDDDEVPGKL
jgi:hypothetical protein